MAMDLAHFIQQEHPEPGLVVLLGPGVEASASALAGTGDDRTVTRLTQRTAGHSEHPAVLLVVHDLVDLRLAATGIGRVGTALSVSVVFEREPAFLPGVVWRPDWPSLEEAHVVRRPRACLRLRFAEPAAVRSVVMHLARSCTPSAAPSSSWPVLGMRRGEPSLWPPDDPGSVVAGPKRFFDVAADSPPDVVVVEDTTGLEPGALESHPVLGRAPVVVRAERDLSWGELDSRTSSTWDDRGPSSLGPVDEKLFNPVGFDREPVGTALPLRGRPDHALVVRREDGRDLVVADAAGRVSDSDLTELRRLPGLDLDWAGAHGPQAYCRAVATLACAGVPMLSSTPPAWAAALLAPALVEELRSVPDLQDALAREEHSIRMRRAALARHGSVPWRQWLAASVGAQQRPSELVSVLLATRRPEMLPFALGQVARQRGASFELLLAPHGFSPDPRAVEEFSARCEAPVTVVEADAGLPFGDVLNRAASRAQGQVLLKMDDDDWYGPDFVHELLLARGFSGAGLVGCLPEITFLEPLRTTTRRLAPTEVFRSYVAGGSMMVDAAALSSIGGFRSTRKYVDAALLRGLSSAGVSVYRTHGLGYVLRRRAEGHTWDPGLDYFLDPARAAQQWQGFRPSALLESQPEDMPGREAGSAGQEDD